VARGVVENVRPMSARRRNGDVRCAARSGLLFLQQRKPNKSGCPSCVDIVNGRKVSVPQRELCALLGGPTQLSRGDIPVDIAVTERNVKNRCGIRFLGSGMPDQVEKTGSETKPFDCQRLACLTNKIEQFAPSLDVSTNHWNLT